jgi:PAS domain S-box-containing protein
MSGPGQGHGGSLRGERRSFRARLVWFAAITSAVAAAMVCAALVTAYQLNTRSMVASHLESHGDVLVSTIAPMLAFNRPDAAANVLESLQAIDHLVLAQVFYADGRLFATRTIRSSRTPPEVTPMPGGLYRQPGWLFHHSPIAVDGEYVGTLTLAYDTRWLTVRAWALVATAFLAAALAMLAAVLVALRLQGSLAGPVREIIRTSRSVTESGDFSVTARRFADDELGELTDEFNAMLARIDGKTTEATMANDRFRLAVESSPNGMAMIDEHGKIILVNAAVERLFGYARAELVGQSVDLLVPPRFRVPHEAHRAGFYLQPQARAMGADRELCALRKDGTEFPVEIGLNPIPTENGLHVLSSIVDITERKQSEAALRDRERKLSMLTNAIPAFAWSSDSAGRTLTLNDQWYEYTGAVRTGSLDAAIGGAVHPEDQQRAGALWRCACSEGTPYESELRIRRRDGAYRWFLARAVPLRDEHGVIVSWFGTSTDIEDRVRAEVQRDELLDSERAARSEAERAGRMKDEFVATLSHELRTPLTAILGWSHMLQASRGGDPLAGEGLAAIERNARAQTRIIEDLLDMSRIVTGKIRLDVHQVRLPDILDSAIATIRPAAEAKGLQLQKIVDPQVGPIHGDANRLQQIAWNLLSNAIKFTPKGGRVQLALQRVDSHIELSVSDTGAGIAPEFLPHVFERFRQGDASTARAHTGLGIGLALVKHLAELHGGAVRAASPGPGQGATFTVVFPLAILHAAPRNAREERIHPTQVAPHQPGGSDSRPSAPDLSGLRVMVVEDERDARVLLQKLLETARVDVRAAASATEALDELEKFTPDVVISDIGMPHMDGYQFIRALRRRSAAKGGKTPAVALTAFARSEDRTRALMAGYQMHMAKPVEPAELLATIAALTSLRVPRT